MVNDKLVKELKERLKSRSISSLFVRMGYQSGIDPSRQQNTICCPFHNDESPSLGINDERGIFNCFGCSASGDYIKAYMLLNNLNTGENLNYYTAAERLVKEDSSLGIKTLNVPEMTMSIDTGLARRVKPSELQKVVTLPMLAKEMGKTGRPTYSEISHIVELLDNFTLEEVWKMVTTKKVTATRAKSVFSIEEEEE